MSQFCESASRLFVPQILCNLPQMIMGTPQLEAVPELNLIEVFNIRAEF
jgi:hypothetical protein